MYGGLHTNSGWVACVAARVVVFSPLPDSWLMQPDIKSMEAKRRVIVRIPDAFIMP
jgi:hypothetical protein